MKKRIITSLFAFASVLATAQETTNTEENTPVWKYEGRASLLGSQSSFNNWQAGGKNNVAINFNINYDINYKKDEWAWDTKFIGAYGLNKLEGADLQKTDDRIEINSIVGRQATEELYYSAFTNFKTQFDKGYNTEKSEYYGKPEYEISRFFSPAYWQTGIGVLYKRTDLTINAAPATARLTFVNGMYTQEKASFGVEKGKTSRFELGFSLGANYKLKIMENFDLENRLNLYSNYLKNPENVDVDYQLNAVFTVNKYISTNLMFQALYDDDAFKGWQTRNTIGVGLTAKF